MSASSFRWTWTDGRTKARLVRMLRSFWASEVRGKARGLFFALLLLLVTINGLNVINSYVGRDFMTALEQRSTSIFIRQALLYLAVFAASTVVDTYLRYTEETLALTWREWLSGRMVGRYLQPPVYHRLSDRVIADGDIANPDERIADDVRAFTATTLSFVLLLLNGTFTIVAFSGVLWSISPPLLLITVLYACAGSLLAIAWGRPLVKLSETQLDKEANFRAELIHVRENAEALAIARREDRLHARLRSRIADLVANFRRIILVHRNLGLFTAGYNYLIQIIPALVVAPLFMRGNVDFGVVTQSAMAFAQLVGAFSLIINQFQPLSAYAAVVTRLGVLEEGIDRAQARPMLPGEGCGHHAPTPTCPLCAESPRPASMIDVREPEGEATVAFERLTLLSPSDGRLLLKDLSGTVTPGKRLLILGPNDEALTAIFRATAGTWSLGSGILVRPADGLLLFLAERPYLPPGTLRETLTSVGSQSTIPEERILTLLHDLDLDPILARAGGLDAERRWDSLLSLGEQQLVSIVRILLAAPKVVFLERPDTALSNAQLSRALEMFAGRGMSVLCVGSPGHTRFPFDAVLDLEADGRWTWK